MGSGFIIGDFVVIGVPPKGCKLGELKTRIGPGAIIRSHTVIYAGNTIGQNLQTGHHVLMREGNELGNDVSVGSGSIIEHHVKIGNGVRIHSQCFVPEFTVLEDGCWLGPQVVVTNASYPLSRGAKENLKGPLVKSGAKIGANATLLPEIVIGENALVGAGSVVTKDVPPYKVVVGNPARVVKDIRELLDKHNPTRKLY